ncbi:hypothetical protein [Rhodococcus globerulus]|uniref:hypothetical protein n=1 Tax=Rhodococcus globerulus TaxID=33008 RepID=UPI003016D9D9
MNLNGQTGFGTPGLFSPQVDELATVQAEVSQDFRDGSARDDDAVGTQLECDLRGTPFPSSSL